MTTYYLIYFIIQAMEASRVRPLLKCSFPEDSNEDCLSFTGKKDSVIAVEDGTDVFVGHKLVLMSWF